MSEISSTPRLRPTILRTKIQAPRLRPDVLDRPELIGVLQAGAWRKLTLICAQAGAGKTTLALAWLRASDRPYTWLSLDENDNNPERFLVHLAASVDRMAPGIAAAVDAALSTPRPLVVEDCLEQIINALETSPRDWVCVLDDLHVLANPALLTALDAFIERLPPCVHLVLLSRIDPPFSLSRWRARGEMTEIRGERLRFNSQEIRSFLDLTAHVHLPAADVEKLFNRTEGWAVGVQLATLALAGQPENERARFVDAFTGSNRFIIDYLAEEVLSQLEPDLQDFLLSTSILERLNAGLCDQVTGRADSREVLLRLERSNLFILALDENREWLRYHTLFSDLLKNHLTAVDPTRPAGLHARAADWFSAAGFRQEAVHHYLAGGQIAQALQLIADEGSQLLNSGQINRMLSWFDMLPAFLFDIAPFLHLQRVWAFIASSQFSRVGPELDAAEAGLLRDAANDPAMTQYMLAMVKSARSILLFMRGDIDQALRVYEEVRQELPPGDPMLVSVLVAAASAYLLAGDTRQSLALFQETASSAERVQQHSVHLSALANQGTVLMIHGEADQAREIFLQAIAVAESFDETPPMISMVYGALADLEFFENHTEEAVAYIKKTAQFGKQWSNLDVEVNNHLRLVRLYLTSGQLDRALEQLEGAADLIKNGSVNPLTETSLTSGWLDYYTRAGRLDQALQWIDSHPEQTARHTHTGEFVLAIAAARALIFAGGERLSQAQKILNEIIPLFQSRGQAGWQLEALTLQSLCRARQGRRAEAIHLLNQTLPLAAHNRSPFTYTQHGAEMAALLADPAIQDVDGIARRALAYLSSLSPAPALKPSAPPDRPGWFEPLTERELEVLQWMADGYSNNQIADQLYLSPGTVKRHLHNIFGKLAVASRVQAIQRAQELGLLKTKA